MVAATATLPSEAIRLPERSRRTSVRAQHRNQKRRAGHVEGNPGQHPLRGRVEDPQLGEQETQADDDADGGESGQDALHASLLQAVAGEDTGCLTVKITSSPARR